MDLRDFVEKTLTDIAEGIKSANLKMDGIRIKNGNTVSFTVSVQSTEEKEKEGGVSLSAKVLGIGGKIGSASKEEVYNTVTFDIAFEEVERGDPFEALPKFTININE